MLLMESPGRNNSTRYTTWGWINILMQLTHLNNPIFMDLKHAYKRHPDKQRCLQIYSTTGSNLTQCVRILGLLKKSGGGLTIAEINARTGLQKSSISARLRELIEVKVLIELPKRKQKIGGCLVRPVAMRGAL